jgi:phosphate transport system permease protein
MNKKLSFSYLINLLTTNIFKISGALSIIILLTFIIFLVKESLPMLQEVKITEFLFSNVWNPDGWDSEYYGAVNLIKSTIFVSILTMLISLPIGVLAAVFLAEFCPKGLRNILKSLIEILAGIPSVVIGFFGIVFIGPFIANLFNQYNILSALNGSILLTIMVLPTIISLSDDAIRAVPEELRNASLALGCNKIETIIYIVVPTAKSGILASIMLGFGRAIGETMAVLMACGNAHRFTGSIFDPIRTITATIAIEMGEVVYYSTHYHALFALGLLLFTISFIINNIVELLIRQGKKKRC